MALLSLWLVLAAPARAASNALLSWNNLGMHCMDSDYSVFSILPPYNTIESQLIVGGRLVTNGSGYTVTYEAVADPDGSFNSTAMGKGNYYTYAQALYGATLPPEGGLAGWSMPGLGNTPQPMLFENTNRPAPGVATRVNWFRAEGIPISPYDDSGHKNPYPLMRLIARNGTTPVATNDIVLPVSDEMDCRACHASGTQGAAQPAAGWVWSDNPERDYRLNILRLHDEYQFADHAALYAAALAARGFNPQGLYRGVVADGQAVLCATCHASEALGTASYSTIPPLTASVHSRHATVRDPDLRLTLDHSDNRAACYRCHPGSTTRCLRGAMGGAVAQDGSLAMQCQSCHGNLSQVGSASRVGWFMEPNCQSCHTGTATHNNGQIRYTSVFTDAGGTVRVPVDTTFATQPNTPAPGLSLYRFSTGHGGLQCSACHGSPHAEFPATHRNDNLRNLALQGHAGVTIECTACHTAMPNTVDGGPHGMHPVGPGWANGHGDLLEGNPALRAGCRACHGADFTGTVLARMQADRVIATKENKFGTKTYWRGRQVSCYDCHDGPSEGDPSTHPPATALNASTNTLSGAAVAMPLPVANTGGAPITFRVVSQPTHGSVGVSNSTATYFPDPGFVGTDTFTFVAWNGFTDSNLGTGTVRVAQGPFTVSAAVQVPPNWPAGWPAPFTAVATPNNTTVKPTYEWDFGDGTPHSTDAHASHAYAAPGTFFWSVVTRASTAQTTASGAIVIGEAIRLSIGEEAGGVTIGWSRTLADAVLEATPTLDASSPWMPAANAVLVGPTALCVTVPEATGIQFHRLRQVR